MFERFTVPARQVMSRAMGEATALGGRTIGTEHLLLALLDEQDGTAGATLRAAGLEHGRVRELVRQRSAQLFDERDAAALRAVGVDLAEVTRRMTETFGPQAMRRSGRGRSPRIDEPAKRALQHALRSAVERHDRSIGSEHLLLGLLASASTATAVLDDAGVPADRVRADLLAALGKAA